jgi:hypothetical protein
LTAEHPRRLREGASEQDEGMGPCRWLNSRSDPTTSPSRFLAEA